MEKNRCGHGWKATTSQTHLSQISTLLRLMTDEEKLQYAVNPDHVEYIQECQFLCSEIIQEVYESQELTPAEQKLIMPQDHLVQAVNNYVEEHPITQINNGVEFVEARTVFLGRLTTEHPPRCLDVLTTKIPNITVNDNYIEWESGRLILNDYKTKKVYGTYIMTLSDETLRIASLMRDFCAEQRKRHLIGCKNDIKDYSHILMDTFERICNRPLSCNILRKMYIEHAWKSGLLKFATDRIQLAKAMGHSVSTQQLVYTKRPCEEEELEEKELEEEEQEEVFASTSGSVEPTKRRMTESQKQIIKNAIEQWQKSDEYVGLVREGRKPVFSWKKLQSQFVNEFDNVSERTMQAYGRHHIAALCSGFRLPLVISRSI
ncbi:hypothetical protein BC832DRAFT_596018 [Gaertneriomyces semiglobifer]|nr:hypothetical protein BC832DRAFT_596018 [Gaertneriomyces semiglobifer]